MSTPAQTSISAASTNSLAVSDLHIGSQERIDVRLLSAPFGAEVYAFDFSSQRRYLRQVSVRIRDAAAPWPS